ncbi:hypothetical protein EYF80_036173 [Liparis tanakae]|uniref:Uncharacterized protein n=1 Tax=Liparis tanakae TaxID=230148 RepID=A0A4Z2GJY7_9TELE|nr:hypothetical protein EYF80_036173 [Liparis tanakae]
MKSVGEGFSGEDEDEPDDPDDEDPDSESEEEESLDDDLRLACFSSFFASRPLRCAVASWFAGPLSSTFLVDSFSLSSDTELVAPAFLGLGTSAVPTVGSFAGAVVSTASGALATPSCFVPFGDSSFSVEDCSPSSRGGGVSEKLRVDDFLTGPAAKAGGVAAAPRPISRPRLDGGSSRALSLSISASLSSVAVALSTLTGSCMWAECAPAKPWLRPGIVGNDACPAVLAV